MSTSALDKQKLYAILSVNFIGTLGYSIVLPFLIFLVKKFQGNEITYGILGAFYPAFQLIGAPILGRWSDRFGRRLVLLLSQAGTLFAWVLFLVALLLPIQQIFHMHTDQWGTMLFTLPLLVLFFARALDGLTGGNISVANAYMADISNDENRQKNFGMMASSANLGFIIGPMLAGLLGNTLLQEKMPVLAAIAISGTALWLIVQYLPESQPCDTNIPKKLSFRKLFMHENKECYETPKMASTSLSEVIKLPRVGFMLVLYFFIFLGFSMFYTAFPVHATGTLEWSIFELGLFLSGVSGIMIFVQTIGLRWLMKFFAEKTFIIGGSIIMGLCFACFVSGIDWMVYPAGVCFAVGNGLLWPSFLSVFSTLGGKDMQGSIQGFGNSAGSLAMIFGLILGGVLYNQFGVYAFTSSLVIFIVITMLSFRIKATNSENTEVSS